MKKCLLIVDRTHISVVQYILDVFVQRSIRLSVHIAGSPLNTSLGTFDYLMGSETHLREYSIQKTPESLHCKKAHIYHSDMSLVSSTDDVQIMSIKTDGTVSCAGYGEDITDLRVDDICIFNYHKRNETYKSFFLKRNEDYNSSYFHLQSLPYETLFFAQQDTEVPTPLNRTSTVYPSDTEVGIIRRAHVISLLSKRKQHGIAVIWINHADVLHRKVMLMLHKYTANLPTEAKDKIKFLPINQNGLEKFAEIIEEGRHVLSIQTPQVTSVLHSIFFDPHYTIIQPYPGAIFYKTKGKYVSENSLLQIVKYMLDFIN